MLEPIREIDHLYRNSGKVESTAACTAAVVDGQPAGALGLFG